MSLVGPCSRARRNQRQLRAADRRTASTMAQRPSPRNRRLVLTHVASIPSHLALYD